MKTSLDDLSMFVSLVDSGSFTIAAKRLNIPKSKLSRHLVQLEKTIGSQLLIRTTRKQQLTELEMARRIIEAIGDTTTKKPTLSKTKRKSVLRDIQKRNGK